MSERRLASEALHCPACGATRPGEERFCPSCGVPLVREVDPAPPPISERQLRARKIKPQLTEGRLVRVAGARNQPEAELLSSLLLEAGIPSLVRRAAAFDVPDFLAAGPRDVLVAESGLQQARDVLLAAEVLSPESAEGSVRAGRAAALRLALGLLFALLVGVALIWLFTVLA